MEANEISRKLLNTEYVYCLSNSSFSADILKVGWTRHNPAYRANQLYTTGLPTPFKIEFLILTQHGRSLEGRIHEYLSRCRVNGSREFFNISISELREVLTNKFSLTLVELSDIIDYLPKQDNTSRRKKKQTSLYKPITPIHSNVEEDPLVDSREVDNIFDQFCYRPSPPNTPPTTDGRFDRFIYRPSPPNTPPKTAGRFDRFIYRPTSS